MHSLLESFQKDAEVLLQPLIADAKLFFKDDEVEYFKWLQKASSLKLFMPSILNDELLPEKLTRPLNQTFKDSLKK